MPNTMLKPFAGGTSLMPPPRHNIVQIRPEKMKDQALSRSAAVSTVIPGRSKRTFSVVAAPLRSAAAHGLCDVWQKGKKDGTLWRGIEPRSPANRSCEWQAEILTTIRPKMESIDEIVFMWFDGSVEN
jgi:hypothetical protein